MQQVRTVIVINDFDYITGGAGQIAISTANALAERGLHIIFFSAVSNPERKDLSDTIERYSTDQKDILNDTSRLNAFTQGLWNRQSARLLRSILSKADPGTTVIHLHGWIKALSPSIGKVLAASDIPVVCTLHDYFTACPNGGFYNFQQEKACHLRAMSLSCLCTNCDVRNYGHKLWRVARQEIQLHFGKIPRKIGHFIAPTKFSENILRPYLPASATIHLLSNPVSRAIPGQPKADISSDRFLFVGRLSKEKGVDIACAAATLAGAHLTVIGTGPMESMLREKYPQVHFKGWLSPDRVSEEMLQARALIFPSVCYETQGLAVLEAFSVGLPVIVSDQCAASEYVRPDNGLTYTSGNAGDLAAKIKVLMTNTGLAEEMSQHAYAGYWERPLLQETYIRGTLAIYEHMLNEKVPL